MNDEERKESRKSTNKQVNGWKWAFIALVALILSSIFFLLRALQPVEVSEPNRNQNLISQEAIELSTSMNKEDTERLINTYLTFQLGEDYENYDVVLSTQLEIHGGLEILGAEVPFTLFFDPYVMENGNVQLRGEGVEVANFSLPVNLVMRVVGNQIAFPEFIALDSEAQMIVINLNELSEDFNFDFEMTQINLIDNVIELNIRMDQTTIFDQIQIEKINEVEE